MICQYFHQWPIGPATDAVVAKWTHPVVHQFNFLSEWAVAWNAFLDRGPAFHKETSPEYGLASSWASRQSCSRSRPPRSSQLLQVTFDDNLEIGFVGKSEFQGPSYHQYDPECFVNLARQALEFRACCRLPE